MDQNLETTLAEGYSRIAGMPLNEGIFSWLFGKKLSPSDELFNRVSDLFERFYDREVARDGRTYRGTPGEYSTQALLDRVDTLKNSVLSEIRRFSSKCDKAFKERDRAFRMRDSYNEKLNYMRDARDDYRSRLYEQRRNRNK